MKVSILLSHLQALLRQYPEDPEVLIYDADSEQMEPITGFLSDAYHIELCSDDVS